jgi:hypothetical protein
LALPDQKAFGAEVRATLTGIVGDSGASAILFYLGEPDPKTFEAKLAAIMGEGAAKLVMQDLRRRKGEVPSPNKRRWFGGRSTGTWLPGLSWLSGLGLPSLLS